MSWPEIIKEMGPYTAPLCVVMGIAIKWLLTQIADMKKERDAALDDAKQLRDQRTTDQVAATQAMGESARVVTEALRDHDDRIDKVLLLAGG